MALGRTIRARSEKHTAPGQDSWHRGCIHETHYCADSELDHLSKYALLRLDNGNPIGSREWPYFENVRYLWMVSKSAGIAGFIKATLALHYKRRALEEANR